MAGSRAPLISVCIPTHHGRAAQLDEALESVVSQLDADLDGAVEVVVSDNGSEDDTRAVVERRRERLGDALVYHRFEENMGFTRNLLRVVDSAAGRHCWLLGSDDRIAPGGLARVAARLRADPGLTGITVNRANVDAVTGEPEADDPRVVPAGGSRLYERAADTFADLGILQDFISTQIVHRERWRAAVERLGTEGVAQGGDFPHLPVLIDMIRRDPRWRWEAEPLLVHRVGRATLGAFGSHVVEHAILVTTHRASAWRSQFGLGSHLYRVLMRKAWLLQAGPFAIAHYKHEPGHSPTVTLKLFRAFAPWYGFLPEFWLKTVPVMLAPLRTLRAGGIAYRAAARLVGSPDGRIG